MTDQERELRLANLYKRQESLYTNIDLPKIPQYSPNLKNIEIPQFTDIDLSKIQFEKLQSLTDFDETVFAKWKFADIPVMVVAGGLGTFTSVMLKDFFASLHDEKFGKTSTLDGGHSGENTDRVPGSSTPGGFGHRWKYGHDILNPFEIDWDQYKELARQTGTKLPVWLKAYFLWIRHLLQDTFSKEGLPIPGNSLLRSFTDPNKPETRELLQYLGTLKMRDAVGAGVTNIVMGAYLWGTEKSLKRVVAEPNYRAFSLMLGANMITLLSGLFVPPPSTSFNWETIPVIGYYGFQLLRLEKTIRKQLKNRDIELQNNNITLDKNEAILNTLTIMDDEIYNQLLDCEKDLDENYQKICSYHNFVKTNVLLGVV